MATGAQIRQERERRGWSQKRLADEIGISQVAIKKIETGETVKSKHLPDIVRVLGLNGRHIMTVPLVGFVGAGAAASLFAEGQGPFDEVDAPDDATSSTVAVEVRGESLGALFDQWLVYYDDVHDPPGRELINKLCVVGCADGRILIKKLTRGQLPGHFTLLSNVEPPIYDVLVEWAARVKTMRPRF